MAIGMNELKVPGNLMSLGALDFGLIVDGKVIIVENFLRRMAERQEHEGRILDVRERPEEVSGSVQEMNRHSLLGQANIFMMFEIGRDPDLTSGTKWHIVLRLPL